LLVKEGEDLACGQGEPSCLWLEPGEAALILENTPASASWRVKKLARWAGR